jgi:hypothetical protein
VRVEHPLGLARGAGGVAEAGGRVLVEGGPHEILVGLGKPVLVSDGVAEGRLRQVGAVRQDHVALDGGKPRGEALDKRHEGEVEEKEPVDGVVDDVDDLLVEQARVDGVVDGPEAGDAVPAFEMPPGVPGERRDPVALSMPSAARRFATRSARRRSSA